MVTQVTARMMHWIHWTHCWFCMFNQYKRALLLEVTSKITGKNKPLIRSVLQRNSFHFIHSTSSTVNSGNFLVHCNAKNVCQHDKKFVLIEDIELSHTPPYYAYLYFNYVRYFFLSAYFLCTCNNFIEFWLTLTMKTLVHDSKSLEKLNISFFWS